MDTNVVVAALRSTHGASYGLLRLWREMEWKLVLSNTLVTEYEEILVRESRSFYLSPAEVQDLLDALCVLAEQHSLPERPLPILTDPDDEPLVHLAAAARVPYLITHNIRHLAPAKQLGIEVVTPGQFLGILKKTA